MSSTFSPGDHVRMKLESRLLRLPVGLEGIVQEIHTSAIRGRVTTISVEFGSIGRTLNVWATFLEAAPHPKEEAPPPRSRFDYILGEDES